LLEGLGEKGKMVGPMMQVQVLGFREESSGFSALSTPGGAGTTVPLSRAVIV